ncbi:sulfite exporter TauE/SafE family protein [Neiella sp. HB171785]|uniref:Sulfite exporter TauE/SafE family protein n=1 Tax=Neiella litorisoli TaxID=2771431 RepID=A0A8J6QUW9_9GAMM|nr:sulfite exporter TauE/SafE family protein [Neiella litorisoli]MBD1389608.1 sulfite exporter TauE/SafE family protein [Neiella litorisoli]
MIDWAFVASLFMIGLFGSGHCLGMCGGLSVALGMGIKGSRADKVRLLVVAQLGRISSYCLIGGLFGWSISQLQLLFGARDVLLVFRIAANLMLILMALYIARWWFGLAHLEKVAAPLWQRIKPIQQAFLPIKSTYGALIVGACWGWLPCGLVYSATVTAMAKGDALSSALAMLAFGLGTTPAVMLISSGGSTLSKWIQNPWCRRAVATALIIFATAQLVELLISH